jgi:zinc protease
LALLLALAAGSACLADAPAAPRKIVSIEGITEYRLENGLRVLVFPDPSTPNVTVNLTVFVGSRHEGYGETGMAHLLEHMVFKGTPSHRDIPRALRDHGAQFNGSTTVDRTNYFETMTGNDENVDFAVALEADRLVNSFVKREDLVSEMTVVRNEFEAGENNPQSVLGERMLASAYGFHNYGKPTIGNRSDIERVPIERLQEFYHKHYQPDNAMLVIAGKFDEAKALAAVSRYFGVLKRPARVLDLTYTEEPPQDGERAVVLRRVGKIAVVGAVYHVPAGPHPDFAAVEILSSVLTAEPAGRLYKALVEGKQASGVFSYASNWHDPGVLEVMARVDRNGSPDEVRQTLLKVLERLAVDKVTPSELERARRELLTQQELLMTRSNVIGRVLSEWGAMGDWRLFFLHRDRLAQVSLEDVNRVAARYVVRSNRTLGMYMPSDQPQRAAVPETPSVEAMVKDYRGTKALAAGEVFDPTPANVEGRVQRLQLPVGLKIALLPKKTRGEAVVARLNLHYGNEESLKGHTSATQFMAQLMERGTAKYDFQAIQDELNRLGARMRAGGQLGTATFSIEAKRKTLPEVLRLLGEVLRQPSFPADQFGALQRETRDGLEQSRTEPMPLAFRDIQRRLMPYPPDDVRHVPTVEESIARMSRVSVDEVRQIYAEQLGAQSGELSVVGDFDPAEVRRIVESTIGDWKAKVEYRRIDRPARTDLAGQRHTIATPDKANAVYVAAEALALTDTDPDYPALEMANFLLGGGTLSSRLGNRVRQKEGLSYGVRSQFSAEPHDKEGRFMIMAICNPANIDRLDKVVAEELERLERDGVGPEELEGGKKAYLRQQQVQRASDSALAGMLVQLMHEGRTFGYYADLEKKIGALGRDDVNAAVRKHIVPARLVIIHAGDFKKQARQPAP